LNFFLSFSFSKYIEMSKNNTLNNRRYLIINEVGRGCEGIVYLCEDTKENNELYSYNVLPLNISILREDI
jgi:hypothetical protein